MSFTVWIIDFDYLVEKHSRLFHSKCNNGILFKLWVKIDPEVLGNVGTCKYHDAEIQSSPKECWPGVKQLSWRRPSQWLNSHFSSVWVPFLLCSIILKRSWKENNVLVLTYKLLKLNPLVLRKKSLYYKWTDGARGWESQALLRKAQNWEAGHWVEAPPHHCPPSSSSCWTKLWAPSWTVTWPPRRPAANSALQKPPQIHGSGSCVTSQRTG